MATKKKLLQAAAGSAGGAGGLGVEEVFSTYLYEGNGSSQAIDNGINLGQSYGSGGISLVRSSQSEVHTSANNDFAYGSSNFTWEAWIMPQVDDGTLNSSNMYIFDHGTGGSGNGGTLTYNYSNGGLQYYDPTNSVVTSTQTLSNYTWAHVAVVRSSGILKVYYNGSQIISFTSSHNFTDNSFIIGGYGGGGVYNWQGVISEIRVSNTARYTSTFTPPTASFTSDSNTILLTGQGSTIVDNSSNALTLTAYGDAKASTFGPFDAADAGEGGLVWIKKRNISFDHGLMDTEQGLNVNGNSFYLKSNSTDAQVAGGLLTAYNASGFTLGGANITNTSGDDYASWTFRKAPKFFDVVTYTGNQTVRTISHNLGSVPGCIIIKNLDQSDGNATWQVYHRSLSNNASRFLRLNATDADFGVGSWMNDTAPTSTEFTLGTGLGMNWSGQRFVAYLFAHNDGDGEFGPTGDQDIIKCGICSGETGSNRDIDLGFEPQFIITKAITQTGDWRLLDNMRGWLANPKVNSTYLNSRLEPNTNDAESGDDTVYIKPNGFYVNGLPGSGNYIYIAIRRGPMAVPTDATEVFSVDNGDGSSVPAWSSGFPVDLGIEKATSTDDWRISSRLSGETFMYTNQTSAEVSNQYRKFDYMDGWFSSAKSSSNYSWMWKRAPNYFDVVAYNGTGLSNVNTVNHNLGVAPEMIWTKRRDSTNDWQVYHSGLNGGTTPEQYSISLNTTGTEQNRTYWNDTAPTSTTFQVTDAINGNGDPYIAYLFASLDGVSKVGSYTGTGSSQTIDCGFSSGARFVLIKRTDSTSPWWLWDSERGIVTGAEPFLDLNSNAQETTGIDWLDPNSLGFSLPASGNNNVSSASYVFYAIA